MENKNNKIRIKDIAAMAGVSEGSVDRILHNRGNVSKKSEAKIRAVLEKINYKPNKYASVLASNKCWHLAYVIPETKGSAYWTVLEHGLRRAVDELQNVNVIVENFYFDQYSEQSFAEAMQLMMNGSFDGCMFVPTFQAEASRFAALLEEEKKPYVLIDSDLQDAHPLCYYGQHSFDSGYMAAKMLEPWVLRDNKTVLIVQENEVEQHQVVERKRGFMQCMSNCMSKAKVVELKGAVEKYLTARYLQENNVGYCVVFNSRAHLVSKVLQSIAGGDAIKLVGYDTTSENSYCLHQGSIWCILGQRPETQGFNALKTLGDFLLFGQRPQRTHYTPIDVLLRENISYYTDLCLG